MIETANAKKDLLLEFVSRVVSDIGQDTNGSSVNGDEAVSNGHAAAVNGK